MKPLITHLLLLFVFYSFGQNKPISNEKVESIKTDVWVPFMEAYKDYDEEKLKSIHSTDIVRINIDQNQIRTGESYLQDFASFLPRMKDQGVKVGIAFVILTTAIDTSGSIAYQTGYYMFKMKTKDENELKPRGYGHFNVGLRKENDKWKIFLDSDKRVEVSDVDFRANEVLYELPD